MCVFLFFVSLAPCKGLNSVYVFMFTSTFPSHAHNRTSQVQYVCNRAKEPIVSFFCFRCDGFFFFVCCSKAHSPSHQGKVATKKKACTKNRGTVAAYTTVCTYVHYQQNGCNCKDSTRKSIPQILLAKRSVEIAFRERYMYMYAYYRRNIA